MKKPTPPVIADDSRIVSVLKKMESLKLRNELQWMKGDGVVSDVTVLPSGVLSLDVALGVGGYPHGRFVEISGPESAGKTTVTLHAIASAQATGGIAAFIDAEHSLDTNYARTLGVDVENLLFSQPDCGEKAIEVALGLASSLSKGDIIVVDSVAALTPRAELEGEMGDAHVGLQARLMSQALRKLTGEVSRSGVIVFFTNQLRMKIGQAYGSPEVTTGGNALKFYASIRLDIRRKEKIKSGDEILGNMTEIKVVKNKVAPPYRVAETEIRYGEGIPLSLDALLLGMSCGLVSKNGAWLSYGGYNLGQGRDKSWEFLSNTPDLLQKLVTDIRNVYWQVKEE